MSSRIAVVTGANRGLGLHTTEKLAALGHTVVLTARHREDAAAAAKELKDKGLAVIPAGLDVGDDASVDAFFAWLATEGPGQVDILVNNAGAVFDGPDDPKTLQTAFNINTLGAYRTIRRALPGMNERGYGRVVNVSSGMGALSDMGGGYAAYRLSKAALNACTIVLGHEAGTNVKVNAVCPGWVRTRMGGQSAPRDLDQGVAGIVWAATLDVDGPHQGFFRDGKAIDW